MSYRYVVIFYDSNHTTRYAWSSTLDQARWTLDNLKKNGFAIEGLFELNQIDG